MFLVARTTSNDCKMCLSWCWQGSVSGSCGLLLLKTRVSSGTSGYFAHWVLLFLGDQVTCREILRCPSTVLPSPAQPYLPVSLLEDRCTLVWGHTSRTPWEAMDPRLGSTDLKVRHGQLLEGKLSTANGKGLGQWQHLVFGENVLSCLLLICG